MHRIDAPLDRAQRSVEDCGESVGEVRAERIHAENARQIAAQRNSWKLEDDPRDARCGMAIACENQTEPQVTAGRRTNQGIRKVVLQIVKRNRRAPGLRRKIRKLARIQLHIGRGGLNVYAGPWRKHSRKLHAVPYATPSAGIEGS